MFREGFDIIDEFKSCCGGRRAGSGMSLDSRWDWCWVQGLHCTFSSYLQSWSSSVVYLTVVNVCCSKSSIFAVVFSFLFWFFYGFSVIPNFQFIFMNINSSSRNETSLRIFRISFFDNHETLTSIQFDSVMNQKLFIKRHNEKKFVHVVFHILQSVYNSIQNDSLEHEFALSDFWF